MNQNILVFVYGTLRKHERNHHFLIGSTSVAQQAWTNGLLLDTGHGYPAMKQSISGKVYGELYRINQHQLHKLDLLEGYSGTVEKNLYDRITQKVYTDTQIHDALIYVIHPENEHMLLKGIESGDWRVDSFLKTKENFLYFAYGSCMDNERFKTKKVDHFFQSVKGCGILDGYQLRFTRKSSDGGRADLVEEAGTVEGKVYEVSADCLTYLYQREGVNLGIYRTAFVDITINGILNKNALTFVVTNKDKETAPPMHYVNEILRGGTGFLSDTYINQLRKKLQEQFAITL